MSTGGLLMCVPLVALLTCAAAIDLRVRRIPNWLTLSLMLCGFAQSVTWAHIATPGQSALGFLTGFGLALLFFAIRAMGGGDVKLLAGIGAWLGPWPTVVVFAVQSILGMAFVLAYAAYTGRLKRLLQNSTVITMTFATAGETGGLGQATEMGEALSSSSRVPWAVPVLLAIILLVCRV